jgi:serine/threonine protein kinase
MRRRFWPSSLRIMRSPSVWKLIQTNLNRKSARPGMGEVFLAQDTKLERKVAIKMLPAKSIDDARARKRLFREARAAATLDQRRCLRERPPL